MKWLLLILPLMFLCRTAYAQAPDSLENYVGDMRHPITMYTTDGAGLSQYYDEDGKQAYRIYWQAEPKQTLWRLHGRCYVAGPKDRYAKPTSCEAFFRWEMLRLGGQRI